MIKGLVITPVLIVVVMLLLNLNATAFAQSDPTASQYGGGDPGISTGSSGSSSGSGGPSGSEATGLNRSVGPLPVTGSDLIVIVAIAIALTSSGLALRAMSHPRTRQENT